MTSHGEPNGERFDPESMGGDVIEAEHRARYLMGAPFVPGRSVLDAGCGVGWGAALLLELGASSVDGVDIAPDAIASARARYPQATFAIGDLLDLPYPDGAFDVVVCFEALEHTSDTSRALDELRRVLASDGVLLVSSPNPAVYPSGNPFHVHELTPEQLAAEAERRFQHVALYRQHLLLASTIVPDGSSAMEFEGLVPRLSRPLSNGFDPYSIAIASDVVLNPPPGAQALVTSHQLVDLGARASALNDERELLRADHERIIAERSALIDAIAAEREDWRAGELRMVDERAHVLSQSEAALRDRDDALRALATAQANYAAAEAARAALGRYSAELAAQIDRLRGSLASAERQRDRLGALLVDSEQQLAVAVNHLAPEVERSARLHAEAAQARAEVEQLRESADELQRVRATKSWRSTKPLRLVRAKFLSRHTS